MVNRQSMQVNVNYRQPLLSVGGQTDKAKQKHKYSHGVPRSRRSERLQSVSRRSYSPGEQTFASRPDAALHDSGAAPS